MLQCATCSQLSADCFLLFSDSYSHYLRAIIWPSVHGLHQGLTACFKAQRTNHSSSMHPLLGSSHFVPAPSLQPRARPLRTKNDTFDLVKVAIWHVFLWHTSWPKLAVGTVKEELCLYFLLPFPHLKYLREAIKNSFVKVLNFRNERINVSIFIHLGCILVSNRAWFSSSQAS